MSEPQTYSQLMRQHGAFRLIAASSLGRLVFGGLPLAMFIFIADARGSYGDAGAALGVYGIAASLLGPFRARVAEKGNTRVVVVAMSSLYLVAVAVFLAAASSPLPVFLAAAAAAGALPPPIGPLTRAEWRRRFGHNANSLRLAYSFDATSEEVIYSVAPLLASFAVGVVNPAWVVAACGVLLFLSGVGLALTLSKEVRESAPDGETTGDVAPIKAPRRRSLLRNGPFLRGLVPIAGLSLMTGGIEVTVIAAALETVDPKYAGIPIAAVAIGSAVGGLLYGRRDYPGTPHQQVRVFVLASGVFILAAAAAVHVFPLLVVLLALAGLWIAPAIVCSYIIAETAAPDVGAEASAWVNATGNLGLSLGTAVAGVVVQEFSPALALVGLVMAGFIVTLVPRSRGTAASRVETPAESDMDRAGQAE